MTIKSYLLFFCTLAFFINAEENRRYFDKDWHETSEENAAFYRPVPLPKVGNLYHLKDYFISGKLQAEAYIQTPDEIVFEGKALWYFENGQLSIERNYVNGEKVGKELVYYENGQLKLERTLPDGKATWYYENGQASVIRHYKNNRSSGEEITYFDNGNERSRGTYSVDGYYQDGTFPNYKGDQHYQVADYKEGVLVGYSAFYADSKTIAEYKEYASDYQTKEKRYYNRAGELISQADYNTNSAGYSASDKTIAGTEQLFIYDNDGFVSDIIGQSSYHVENGVITIETTLKELAEPLVGTYSEEKKYNGKFYNYKTGEITTQKDGHKDGEVLCCYNQSHIRIKGEYQYGALDNGAFYHDYEKKVSHYQNGLLHGQTIYYDKDFNEIASTNYENERINGKRITRNPDNGEVFEAEYDQDMPVSGSVYEYDYLRTYENKILIEETRFDYNTHKKVSKDIYKADGSYSIEARETYVGEKTYRIDYKDGRPYNGEEYVSGGLFTYKEGILEGPYFIVRNYDPKFKEQGHYVDGKKEGTVTYELDGETFTATFSDGKPIDGTVYDEYNGGKQSYKDGKKNGLFTQSVYSQYFDYDKLIVNYENDIPVGKAEFYFKGQKVAEGQYKDGKPFDGEFYESDGAYGLHSYQKLDKGQLLESTEIKGEEVTHHWYDNGKLSRKDVTFNKQTHTLTYKDGKPWQGEQVSLLTDNYFTKEVTLTNYSEGMKNGAQLTYTDIYSSEPTIEENYVNDQPDGEQYFYLQNGIVFSSHYENGKPIQGKVVKRLSAEILAVTNYKAASPQQVSYIGGGYGSYYKTWIEGEYQQGEPYSGYFYNVYGSSFTLDLYEQGVLVKSYLKPRLSYYNTLSDNSAEVVITMQSLKDEVRPKHGNYTLITYDDKSKQSGKADSFTAYDELANSIYFKDKQITAIENGNNRISNYNYNYPFYYYSYQLSEDKQQIIIIGENQYDFKITTEVANTFDRPMTFVLSGIEGLLGEVSKPVFNYYYNDSKEPVASYTINANGYPESGVFITPTYNSTDEYTFNYYENAQVIKTETMTIEAFIKNKEK